MAGGGTPRLIRNKTPLSPARIHGTGAREDAFFASDLKCRGEHGGVERFWEPYVERLEGAGLRDRHFDRGNGWRFMVRLGGGEGDAHIVTQRDACRATPRTFDDELVDSVGQQHRTFVFIQIYPLLLAAWMKPNCQALSVGRPKLCLPKRAFDFPAFGIEQSQPIEKNALLHGFREVEVESEGVGGEGNSGRSQENPGSLLVRLGNVELDMVSVAIGLTPLKPIVLPGGQRQRWVKDKTILQTIKRTHDGRPVLCATDRERRFGAGFGNDLNALTFLRC